MTQHQGDKDEQQNDKEDKLPGDIPITKDKETYEGPTHGMTLRRESWD